MTANDNAKYNSLILRVFLGLTVLLWGYEKLVVEKLNKSYVKDGTLLLNNNFIGMSFIYLNPADAKKKWNKIPANRIYI